MNNDDIFMAMSKDNEVTITPPRELRVLSGLHKGAALTLALDIVTVGSDLNCTVVLLDEGVKPLHLSLQWIDGKGWIQVDTPDIPLSGPLRAGPVWLCLVAPGSPWTDLDQLHCEDSSLTHQNSISSTPTYAGFKHAPFVHSMRRWALLSVCISSLLLLLVALKGQHTEAPPGIDAATGPKLAKTVVHKTSQPPSIHPSQNPILENPNKDVMAVVSGKSGFVLMRDGHRVYVGKEFGHFVLVDVQGAFAVWHSKLHPSDEE